MEQSGDQRAKTNSTGEEVEEEDIYGYQREELLSTLKDCWDRNEPLVVWGKPVLTPDAINRIFQKIKQHYPFSSRERTALQDAGYNIDALFPNL